MHRELAPFEARACPAARQAPCGEAELPGEGDRELPEADGWHHDEHGGATSHEHAVESPHDRVEIRDGLARTDKVVARGAGFLGDGDIVKVVADSAAPAAGAKDEDEKAGAGR